VGLEPSMTTPSHVGQWSRSARLGRSRASCNV
jgi:hypothetical protein